MNPYGAFRILGILLACFALTLLVPAGVSLIYQDGEHWNFAVALALTLGSGLVMWWPVRKFRDELRFRDGFLVAVLVWVILSAFAAIPFMLSDSLAIDGVDALFEATSGLTTTGSTVLAGLDGLPRSILYYRQQLQWLGGMGLVVLAVAILPALGVGGMQLYRAETPGPMKDSKLTPRIRETAKAMWYIYLSLTVICAAAYFAAGMTVFDAVCHAFSTIAIGGFSTHDASLGYFDSRAVYLVACIFMILAGLNFVLHYVAVRSGRLAVVKWVFVYLRDHEARTYLSIIAAAGIVTALVLVANETYPSVSDSIVHGFVQAVSIGTTTGFTTQDFSLWPTFIPLFLIILSTSGGCAGSTGGGMKTVRIMLLFKQGVREISKLVHPHAIVPTKLGGKPVSEDINNAVWGFLSLYIFSFTVLLLAMLATGVDMVTAFSSVIACLNNLGPGLGDVVDNYAGVSDIGKMMLTFAMLLGRLELYTLLVLFAPVFWRG
ncbi:MAG: potassium transporter [Gammaproteobacteria bacterium]|nr:potassium transporter [Gammaproteobacteria bacterium]MYD77143.1 potassium transporter [Gammaproteobacteria bacterium]MYJ52893.1 potassium transporter [Gammaproteobacteria bacterium]